MPGWAICRSKLDRSLPIEGVCGSTACPSGSNTLIVSMGRGRRLGVNAWSELAASIVTQEFVAQLASLAYPLPGDRMRAWFTSSMSPTLRSSSG